MAVIFYFFRSHLLSKFFLYQTEKVFLFYNIYIFKTVFMHELLDNLGYMNKT